jgi:hypothetical protein
VNEHGTRAVIRGHQNGERLLERTPCIVVPADDLVHLRQNQMQSSAERIAPHAQ